MKISNRADTRLKLMLSLLIATTFVHGCSEIVRKSDQDTNQAPIVPAKPVSTFLQEEIAVDRLEGFNLCTNPAANLSIYSPPGFEWESATAFYGAMHSADASITGGEKDVSNDPITLFDATVANLKPDLYPSRLVVQELPVMSIESVKESFAKADSKDWKFLGSLNLSLGKIPVFERVFDAKGLKGANVEVVQRRYVLCWRLRCFAVFTYRPASFQRVAYDLEQSALTVRPQQFAPGSKAVLPPESRKSGEFTSLPDQTSQPRK